MDPEINRPYDPQNLATAFSSNITLRHMTRHMTRHATCSEAYDMRCAESGIVLRTLDHGADPKIMVRIPDHCADPKVVARIPRSWCGSQIIVRIPRSWRGSQIWSRSSIPHQSSPPHGEANTVFAFPPRPAAP